MYSDPHPDDPIREPDEHAINSRTGVNLREFLTRLQCWGMPEASEYQVMVTDDTSHMYSPTGVRYDHESDTVWLTVTEY